MANSIVSNNIFELLNVLACTPYTSYAHVAFTYNNITDLLI